MIKRVLNKEAGIETITINEFLIECKNRNITAATNRIAIIKSYFTASAASIVNNEPS